MAEAAGASVWTTGGPIALDDLGRTLVHEHILVHPPGAELDPTAHFDRTEVLIRAVDAMAQLHDHGVRTVIDPCPIEQGRDPELLAEVASRSGIRIVCATGFYIEEGTRGIPFYWRQRQVEEICELYLSELERGIGGTGIRPGVIKAATGTVVGQHERKAVLAAAMAAAQTGVTVITHTEHSLHGDQQVELLRSGGADLSRCLIGHLDGLTPEALIDIARSGAMVGIDRVGWEVLGSEEHRADLVVAMFEAGLGAQVCISQDRVSTYWSPRPQFWVPDDKREYVEKVRVPALHRDGTEKGYCYLFTHFIPSLIERGLTEQDIDTLLIDNPRRLLGG